MDRLTHISITNCIKELDALEKLVLSENFTPQEIADFLQEVSWNLSNVFRRVRYNSDEFQHRLRRLIQENKRRLAQEERDKDPEDG
jgi:hypothetical protein